MLDHEVIIIMKKKKIKKIRDCWWADHSNCNPKKPIPDHIPIVFHNLSGCIAHLFKKVARKKMQKIILELAENKERYISFNNIINISFNKIKTLIKTY